MYRPLVAGGVGAQKGGQSPPVGWHRAVPMYQELSSHPKLTWGWGQEGTHIVAPGDAGVGYRRRHRRELRAQAHGEAWVFR